MIDPEEFYEDQNTDIHSDLYGTDFDDAGFEPEEFEDDSDADAADLFNY